MWAAHPGKTANDKTRCFLGIGRGIAKMMQHCIAKIFWKLKRFRRTLRAVHFNGGDVKRQRCETQCGFAYVKTCQLLVKNVLDDSCVRSLFIMQPPLTHQAPICE